MRRIIAYFFVFLSPQVFASDVPDFDKIRGPFKMHEDLFYLSVWKAGWETKVPSTNIPQVEETFRKTVEFEMDDVDNFILGSSIGFIHLLPQRTPGKITIELETPTELLASNMIINQTSDKQLTLDNHHQVLINGHYACILPGFKEWKHCSSFFECITVGSNETYIKFMRAIPDITDFSHSSIDMSQLMFDSQSFILTICAPQDMLVTVDADLWGIQTEELNAILKNRFNETEPNMVKERHTHYIYLNSNGQRMGERIGGGSSCYKLGGNQGCSLL